MLKEAIDSSLHDLQPWVPWAMLEPSPIDLVRQRLIAMRAQFNDGEDWPFGVFDAKDGCLLGGAGLHPRGSTDHLEIGYWLRTGVTGRGLASEAVAALCAVGLACTSVGRLEIHCDAENDRSAAVARRLGFHLARTFPQEAATSRGTQRDTLVWVLPRSEASRVGLSHGGQDAAAGSATF